MASSSAGCSNSKLMDRFTRMGFSEKLVAKAIRENGEKNTDSILEVLLTYSASSIAECSNSNLMDRFTRIGFSEKLIAKAIRENGEKNTDSILEALLTYSACSSVGCSNSELMDGFTGTGFSEKLVAKAIRKSGEKNTDPIIKAFLTYSASSSARCSYSKLMDRFTGMGFSEKLVAKAIQENGEKNTDSILEALLTYSASSCGGCSNSKLMDRFTGMGFSENLVAKAIRKNGVKNIDSILEALLTYSALENIPLAQQNDTDNSCSDYEGSFLDDFSDIDRCSDSEVIGNQGSDEKKCMSPLVQMGYSKDEVSIAIESCGPHSTLEELTDFICGAQISRASDEHYIDLENTKPKHLPNDLHKKRRHLDYDTLKRKKRRAFDKNNLHEDDEPIRLPNPMIGFGVPSKLSMTVQRTLPEAAIGPPYFYYENVALAPKGVWSTISRFLYDVEPEFVDSKYFCAAARKRGYIHNLPISNRFPLLPFPPHTIHEAFPLTRKWWPSWDTRTQLNCLQTVVGSAKLTDRIRKALEDYDGDREPPLNIQKYVTDECRKWNLVWVGKNKLAPLEPDEVEMLLGFPKNHTRGGGISRTDRHKSLGNSFQVDTVAYHLSVLKDMFPGGINLLSLFSGIGGAEVALHRLGIPLKNVVSVDISELNRNIVRSWWEETNQKGNLIDFADVRQLDADRLEQLMNAFGGFDLVVGGSPCNNLAGSNRVSRDGLEGKESSLFYDYFRILDIVKCTSTKFQ